MNHRLRMNVFLSAAATAIVACGIACNQKASQSKPPELPPANVVVGKPLVQSIVEWDEYTGRLESIDSVEVRARVSGYLLSTHFEEGRMVKEDDLLAIIDPRPFEAELKSAEAKLREANARLAEANALLEQANAEKSDADAELALADQLLARARDLARRNAVTAEEVEVRVSEQLQATATVASAKARIASATAAIATANATIETAAAAVETADLNLGYTRIRAPISGRVSKRFVTEGNLISGGSDQSTLLTTIVSLNPIHIYFDANEQEFLKYVRLSKLGQRGSSREVKNPVFVALVDETGFPHTGHMDFVDNRVDPNTGTMRGRAILSNNDELLTPGLFAKVRLPGSGKYDAIMVPDIAIGSDQSERFVYVVESNKAVRRPVELGPISHGLRIIRNGLLGTETIILRGLQRVSDGASVVGTNETIVAESSELPDSYQPVPVEEWLSRKPADVPEGIEFNRKSDSNAAAPAAPNRRNESTQP